MTRSFRANWRYGNRSRGYTCSVTSGRRKLSHTRTVVRECCKSDDESLWEKGKFDNPPPKNPLTKIYIRDYVGNIYHHAKFYPNLFRGFVSAHAWFRAPRHKVTQLFWGSWEKLQPRRSRRFWRKIYQTARKCLLESRNQYLKFRPPFSPITVIFGPISTGQNFFRPKTALTLNGSRVNDP